MQLCKISCEPIFYFFTKSIRQSMYDLINNSIRCEQINAVIYCFYTFSKKIKYRFTGNFTKLHPTKLLEKIEVMNNSGEDIVLDSHTSTEANKILKKGRKIDKKINN